MNIEVRKLEPKVVWEKFADLNAIPRASKKEEKVIAFMLDFGKKLGLKAFSDEVGNVIIRKPATTGMENRKAVVLQSHLDMVHQKNSDTVFDFLTQGIEMYVDGDWVKAKGTTLGADNGMGVATIMAILQSTDIKHPAIEALFTIDEETGMGGAFGLQAGVLQGEILLNLDTEEDDEIDIGCAGGIDVTAVGEYEEEEAIENSIAFNINVKGLKGGHSGMDIDRGLGNANKIMNRLLFDGFENFGLRISEVNGGGLRNAIPRESYATIVVDSIHSKAFEFEFNQLAEAIKREFKTIEPTLLITIGEIDKPKSVMNLSAQIEITKAIYAAQNGVYSMSNDMEDLVETSNNIARVEIGAGQIKVSCLTRSSVESSKIDLANALRSAFELARCEVKFSGSYPGWNPNVNSPILKVLSSKYEALFGEKAKVVACHAGLECGILGQNYPDIDMISYGPTIKGAHSPDERVCITSVQKFWNFTLEILMNIPIK